MGVHTFQSSFTRRITKASTVFFGGLLVLGFAASGVSAQENPLLPTPTFAPTTVAPAPPSTTAPTTAAPTTAAPTTAAPTSVPSTQVVPTSAVPAQTVTTAAPIEVPAVVAPTPTTIKKKAASKPDLASSAGNPNAKGATSVVVSIAKQRMYIYKGGQLYRSIPVSTGSGKKYCNRGKCAIAHTPRGSFRVQRRIGGWRTSALGRLYNPLYFSGGYAIHGSGSVPRYPASHGCVRVSMANARWLPSAIPNGTPVRIG